MRACTLVCCFGLWLASLTRIGIGSPADADTPPGTLFASSTRVASLGDVSEETYFWSSDHEVLFFRHVPQPFHRPVLTKKQRESLPLVFDLPSDFAPGYYQTLHVDIRSGEQSLMEPFTTEFGRTISAKPMIVTMGGGTPPTTHYMLPPCALSPDGAWLVWLSKTRPSMRVPPSSKWIAARLDGSQSLTWIGSGSADGYPAWRDASHWVELVQDYQPAQKRYVFPKAVTRGITATSHDDQTRINAVADGILEGVTHDGSLLVACLNLDGPVRKTRLTEYGLDGSASHFQTIVVSLPHPAQVDEVSLSTDGSRLAWVLSDADNAVYQIWVSGLHGEKMRCVGSTKSVTVSAAHGERVFWPQSVRWLPGDDRLSFVFRHALWTIPVSGGVH